MAERLQPNRRDEWLHAGHQHLQRYQFALAHIEGDRVLDLACGVGYGSYILAQARNRQVTGVDLDPEAIAYGKTKYQHPQLRMLVGDALKWRHDEPAFDTIVSFETIEHLPNPAEFVRRVARLLKPGGTFIVSAPNTLQHKLAAEPIENEFHLNEPDYATLRGWIDPQFTVESEWEQSTVIRPGEGDLDYLRTEAAGLRGRWWVRAANRLETGLRQFGRSNATPTERIHRPRHVSTTEILPLLPERRSDCEVFVFVCQRTAANT